MKVKPEIGQTLYSLNVGSRSRHTKQELTEVKVIKVGRKCFTCCIEGQEGCYHLHIQYFIDTWLEKTDYCESTRLYGATQQWDDEKEHAQLSDKIRKLFDIYSAKKDFSLDQLRKVDGILCNDN